MACIDTSDYFCKLNCGRNNLNCKLQNWSFHPKDSYNSSLGEPRYLSICKKCGLIRDQYPHPNEVRLRPMLHPYR